MTTSKAIWKDVILAESSDIVIVEGNEYFPDSSLKKEYFSQSNTTTQCPWKGTANYYNITVDGKTNRDAAWYYPEPKPAASNIRNRVAFWKGVEIDSPYDRRSMSPSRRTQQSNQSSIKTYRTYRK